MWFFIIIILLAVFWIGGILLLLAGCEKSDKFEIPKYGESGITRRKELENPNSDEDNLLAD